MATGGGQQGHTMLVSPAMVGSGGPQGVVGAGQATRGWFSGNSHNMGTFSMSSPPLTWFDPSSPQRFFHQTIP